jgi:insulysin
MVFQFFDIIKSKNEKRQIKGLILKNSIKVVIVSDPDIIKSGCCVGINAGYLQDEYEGTAHFLEHLLFMGSKKFKKQNDFLNYIHSNNGESNAYTEMNSTCYYLNIDSSKFKKAVEMLSWFFKSPLLGEENIKSEMEIINSEHEKNKNNDFWIMDDIFKNFVETKKYKKFGTGNNESLKNIKYDDIMHFYNKYYTTENTYVCIFDTNSIEDIIKNYVPYFEDIEIKTYSGKKDKKEEITLIDENYIIFKSISDHNFLNFYLIFDALENNQEEYQLMKFINEIIGKEYENSLCYELIENYNVKSIASKIEYFLDKQVIININIFLNNNEKNDVKEILNCFKKYMDKLSELKYNEFEKLYNNYKNIREIKLLYKTNNYNDGNDMIDIVDNLMKSDNSLCLNKKYIVSDVSKNIFEKYISILKTNIVKIITNIGFDDLDKKKISDSKYYNSNYYITNINYNGKTKCSFEIMNYILYDNIKIKYMEQNKNLIREHKKMEMDDIKTLYFFDDNKYGNMCSLILIRKNTNLLKTDNEIMFFVYCSIISKILNYYLHQMNDFQMNFNINCNNEFYTLNFYGINLFIKEYIIKIIDVIQKNNIFEHKHINKYFKEVIEEFIQDINNEKYEMPYIYTYKYIQKIVLKDYSNNKKIKILKDLTLHELKKNYDLLFNFNKEYILLDGFKDNELIHKISKYDIISINDIKIKKICVDNFNYQIKKSEIIKTESNKCLCTCYIVENINLVYDINNLLNKDLYELIIKKNILYEILSNMISEKMFHELRTKGGLGYIIKTLFKNYSTKNNLLMSIIYIIQSKEKIEIIKQEINKFNIFLKKKINDKEFKYEFEKMKKLKIQEMEKFKLNNIYIETNYYKKTISNNSNDFDLINLKLNILKKINFDHITEVFENFIKTKPSHIIYTI